MFKSLLKWLRPLWTVIPLLFAILFAGGARADHEPLASVVARVSPAVVRIITVRPRTTEPASSQTVGANAAMTTGTNRSTGSGFIIDPSGYIGTNKHVVEGAVSVFVVTAAGVRYHAQVVGMPDKADMALLRIDAGHDLPFVQFGDSDTMRVGDKVFAIGSPFGFDNTVTSGIISALHRDIMESPFDDYLQTDTAINHGNSGGPLFNEDGHVVGMTSVIFSPDPGSSGVGFALPSNSLRFVFDRLMTTGAIHAGMLPIHTQQVTWMLEQAIGAPDLLGALVTSVQDDAGTMLHGKIRAGDVVRSFNGQPVLDPRDLARKAAMAPVGSDAVLEISRGGAMETERVTIREWPEATPIVLTGDGRRELGLDMVTRKAASGVSVVMVSSVDPAGTAADSGILKDDVIVQVQETPVADAEQARHIFGTNSSLKHHFAAVLVNRDGKFFWIPLAIPD
jgi:serine protease Do